LRFGFLGTTRNNKGLRVLVDAIPLLPTEVRRRCHFLIRASGDDRAFRQMLSAYPEVQFAGGYDALQLLAAASEYDVGILTHVWFENSPLGLLAHSHAFFTRAALPKRPRGASCSSSTDRSRSRARARSTRRRRCGVSPTTSPRSKPSTAKSPASASAGGRCARLR